MLTSLAESYLPHDMMAHSLPAFRVLPSSQFLGISTCSRRLLCLQQVPAVVGGQGQLQADTVRG